MFVGKGLTFPVEALIPYMVSTPAGFIYGADGFSCGARSIYPRSQFFLHLVPVCIFLSKGSSAG